MSITPAPASAAAGANIGELAPQLRERLEQALGRCLPAAQGPAVRLAEAMRYACLGGGKRVRALLVYAAGSAVGARLEHLDAPACAVELMHAYSLVHDDMPAMDDDDLRRGKPTCHRAFDEATALLAGDALQTLAFRVLSEPQPAGPPPGRRLAMVHALAEASGAAGMAGGQAIDLAAAGRSMDLHDLEQMHRMKTGALIRASVRLGALACPAADPGRIERLEHFAGCIGLAFQIRDDVLDVEAPTETLGKRQGADAARQKPTYPSLLGLAASKTRAEALYQEALQALECFDARAQMLRDLAQFIVQRGS